MLDLRHVTRSGCRGLHRSASAFASVYVGRVPVPPIVRRGDRLERAVTVGRLVQEGSRLDFTAMAGSTGLAFQIGAGMRAHLAPRLTLGIGLVAPVWTGVASDLREDVVGTIGPGSKFVEFGLWGLVGTTF